MLRTSVRAAVTLAAVGVGNALCAQSSTAPAPPAWRDNASVYLAMDQSAEAGPPAPQQGPAPRNHPQAPAASAPGHETAAISPVADAMPRPAPLQRRDYAVQHAVHHSERNVPSDEAQRRLAPPSRPIQPIDRNPDTTAGAAKRSVRRLEFPWKSAPTMGAALGIVVGAFLLCAWLFRRGVAKNSAALPGEVVSVLGRVPLAPRHVAQLLRVGNKLVLVSLTPAGAETITEVTDPAEVDRLVGMCQQYHPHSSTKSFEHVFRHLSREPGPDVRPDQEATFAPQLTPFEARHAYRREAVRG